MLVRGFRILFLLAFATLLLASCSGSSTGTAPERPNILFVIMDDVGIDQMPSFGYGGATPPNMPNIDAVAQAGLRFGNTWSMPECSPGRAAMFVGRYPLRTNIYQAIGENDLANSQLTPDDMTTPKLLRTAGYESGLFGKFHLAGPENNAAGNGTPGVLGWDYFYGWVGGLPASIDTTAGGVAPQGTYPCGFVPPASRGGADSGACYLPDKTCQPLVAASPGQDAVGKQCVTRGGIFVPRAACQATPPASLDFGKANAYYVSPLVINSAAGVEVVPLTDRRARGYRTSIEVDAAINWIRQRSPSRPWMATVSLTGAHTPIQQPPSALTPRSSGTGDALGCTGLAEQRDLQNRMIEAMDTEVGRLLVETGLARRSPDGTLAYTPAASNTMIVIVGDNGTLGNMVKLPFNAQRAKGTAYQTGVWVPLIVSGPLVNQANRSVEHMVNMVDVYQLFGEIAGIDVHASVPRVLDSATLLPYLRRADQPSVRSINFSQGGANIQRNGGRNGPCVIGGNTCSHIPINKGVCEDNGGVWWGSGATDPSVPNKPTGYQTCCQVNQALYKAGKDMVGIMPDTSTAIRNATHKVVRNTVQQYDSANDSCSVAPVNEFYAVDQNQPKPTLDDADKNLLTQTLSAPLKAIYDDLTAKLDRMLASQPACVGDGNIDGVVNAQDLDNWRMISQAWGLSSTYDLNFDGLTNDVDRDLLARNAGPCAKAYSLY